MVIFHYIIYRGKDMRVEKGTVEFTNMVMVEDKAAGKVLVQERRKSWTGLSFPGGHVEQGDHYF